MIAISKSSKRDSNRNQNKLGRLQSGKLDPVQGLVRVSSPKQEKKNGDYGSRNLQRDSIESYVVTYKSDKWKVCDIIDDPCEQGDAPDRPSIQKLLYRARHGYFKILLVFAQDRLSRKWALLEPLCKELEDMGIEIYTTSGRRISVVIPGLRDETRREAIRSEEELDRIRHRCKSSRAGATAQGIWSGVYAPFGLIKRRNKKNIALISDKVRAPIYQEVTQRIRQFEHRGSILANMKSRGVRTLAQKTKKVSGKPKKSGKGIKAHKGKVVGQRFLTLQHLEDMVNCPLYTGHTYIRNYRPELMPSMQSPVKILSDGTALFKSNIPELITIPDWEETRHAWNNVNKAPRAPRRCDLNGDFLLQGISRCACGETLTPRREGDGRLICMSVAQNTRGLKSCCQLRSVSSPIVERAVLDVLCELAKDSELVDRMLNITKQSKRSSDDEKMIKDLKNKIQTHRYAVDRLIKSLEIVHVDAARIEIGARIDEHHISIRNFESTIAETLRGNPKMRMTRDAMIIAISRVFHDDIHLVSRIKLKSLLHELIESVTVGLARTTAEGRVLEITIRPRHAMAISTSSGIKLKFRLVESGTRSFRFLTPFERVVKLPLITTDRPEPSENHPLVQMRRYSDETRTMSQRKFACSINKTEAHVSQYCSLMKIAPDIRAKILKSPPEIRSFFGLKQCMRIAKLKTHSQQLIEVQALIQMLRPKPAHAVCLN